MLYSKNTLGATLHIEQKMKMKTAIVLSKNRRLNTHFYFTSFLFQPKGSEVIQLKC